MKLYNVRYVITKRAELVQPGTTSASQAEGRGFKSRTPHQISLCISECIYDFVKFHICKLWSTSKQTMNRTCLIRRVSWNQVYMNMRNFLSTLFSIMDSN